MLNYYVLNARFISIALLVQLAYIPVTWSYFPIIGFILTVLSFVVKMPIEVRNLLAGVFGLELIQGHRRHSSSQMVRLGTSIESTGRGLNIGLYLTFGSFTGCGTLLRFTAWEC